jgi:hypothetical protein
VGFPRSTQTAGWPHFVDPGTCREKQCPDDLVACPHGAMSGTRSSPLRGRPAHTRRVRRREGRVCDGGRCPMGAPGGAHRLEGSPRDIGPCPESALRGRAARASPALAVRDSGHALKGPFLTLGALKGPFLTHISHAPNTPLTTTPGIPMWAGSYPSVRSSMSATSAMRSSWTTFTLTV